MSKRTRYFMIGAVAFLIVGLSIGLVAYYNGGLQGLTQAGGPDELRYVPDDAAVVAYANVHQIMNSEFRQRMKQLEAGKGERGQQEFKDETGIDIERDVDHVLAFMTADQTAPEKGGVVIASGRFDSTRIENLVKSKGGAVTEYRGKRLITFNPVEHAGSSTEHPGKGGALVFLRGDLVAVGSADAIKRTVDVSEGSAAASVKANSKMEELIRDVAPRGNAWVVGRFDALSSQAKLPDEVTSRIPPISWFAASGEIDGGVAADLTVETSDDQAAVNLKKVIDGLMGLAGLQMGTKAPQMQQLLQSFAVSQAGPRLTVSFKIPSDLILGLASHAKQKGASRE
jgi:hypothetical protein